MTTSTVIISANGETWTHEAYALTLGAGAGTSTPERQALLDFITQLTDLSTLVGAENLGETTLFEPTEYAIQAVPVEDLSVYGRRRDRAHRRRVADRRLGPTGRRVVVHDDAGERDRRHPGGGEPADVLLRRRRHLPAARPPCPPRLDLLTALRPT